MTSETFVHLRSETEFNVQELDSCRVINIGTYGIEHRVSLFVSVEDMGRLRDCLSSYLDKTKKEDLAELDYDNPFSLSEKLEVEELKG